MSYDFLKVILGTPKQIVEFSLFIFRNLHYVSKSFDLSKIFSLDYLDYWLLIALCLKYQVQQEIQNIFILNTREKKYEIHFTLQ